MQTLLGCNSRVFYLETLQRVRDCTFTKPSFPRRSSHGELISRAITRSANFPRGCGKHVDRGSKKWRARNFAKRNGRAEFCSNKSSFNYADKDNYRRSIKSRGSNFFFFLTARVEMQFREKYNCCSSDLLTIYNKQSIFFYT